MGIFQKSPRMKDRYVVVHDGKKVKTTAIMSNRGSVVSKYQVSDFMSEEDAKKRFPEAEFNTEEHENEERSL